MAHVDTRYRALYSRLKDSLSDFTAEQVTKEGTGRGREGARPLSPCRPRPLPPPPTFAAAASASYQIQWHGCVQRQILYQVVEFLPEMETRVAAAQART